MILEIPEFKEHNLTGYPSWYKTDYPDNPDADFPLVGYITNQLSDPHDSWREDYKEHVERHEAAAIPRVVRLRSRVLSLSRWGAVRLVVAVYALSVVFGGGAGYVLALSASPVPETAAAVSVDRSLKVRNVCFSTFHMPTGTWKQVCD